MNIRLLKWTIGLLLIGILLGHNFVFNQPQALQETIMQVHKLPTTQFNLLYTLQTLPTLFLIIPLGVMFDSYGPKMLIPASFLLVLGQLIMIIYTPLESGFSFVAMIGGRIMQGIGAEILYMGQGVLATKWMGNLVGLVLVLPEVGEIANAFVSPKMSLKGGLYLPLVVGLLICVVSFLATILLNFFDKKYGKIVHNNLSDMHSEDVNCSKIGQFSRLFWILIAICAIDESIYIPFMDNANTLIRVRFGIQYSDTGKYLCIPFISAMLATLIFSLLLKKFSKQKLAFLSGVLGVTAHILIYMLPNSDQSQQQSHFMVLFAFFLFGFGLGSYYAIIYPLVGLTVKKQNVGTAYAIVSFVQAAGMAAFPELSAFIIQREDDQQDGYTNSSLLFVATSIIGLAGCLYLLFGKQKILTHIGHDDDKDAIYMEGNNEQSNSVDPDQRTIESSIAIEMSPQPLARI